MTDVETLNQYPNLCLEQALGGRVVSACAECPLPNPAADCLPYQAAQRIVSQETEISRLTDLNETLTGANLLLLERILGLKIDSLVDGMFTPEGLRDEIEYDQLLSEKLMGNNWAALQVDVRFLNFINGVFGQNSGDSFLQHSGDEISSIAHGLLRQGAWQRRTQQTEVGRERRTRTPVGRRAADYTGQPTPGHTPRGDILCRRGGDEFTVILFDIKPEDLAEVVKRWQRQLDVAAALKRAPDGIPFIGSVGAVHVADIDPEMLAGRDAYGRYRLVDDVSNVMGREAKKIQYNAMWKRLLRDSRGILPAGLPQPEDRAVAEMFIRQYFSGFIANHSEILGERQD